MIRVRVIEAQEIGLQFRGTPLRFAIVLGPYQEPAPRTLFRGVGKRKRRRHHAVAAVERAAALVGIRLRAVAADVLVHSGFQHQRHQRVPSSQKRSERYFSPPSQKTTTITASFVFRATCSAPARLAPLEMPTNNPCRASRRVRANASSVLTPRSSSAMLVS